MEIQASSLAKDKLASSVSAGPAELLNAVNIWYRLKEDELKTKLA